MAPPPPLDAGAAAPTAVPYAAQIAAWRADFAAAFARMDRASGRPVLVLSHDDADGLGAAAVLARALPRAPGPPGGTRVEVRLVGRGEDAWSEAMRADLRDRPACGLVVADLGTRGGPSPRPDLPTVVVDHHVPRGGAPEGDVTVISGHPAAPQPPSALLAHHCAGAVAGDVSDLAWLAGLGIVGDLAEKGGFPELDAARAMPGGITGLREAVSLLNAARRSAAGAAAPALAVLMRAANAREVVRAEGPEADALRAAREEVRAELEAARRVAPKVVGEVALVRLHSPCQVHPLVAQSWLGRLRGKVVVAANTGYRPGRVHFAARGGPPGVDLTAFLRARAPSAEAAASGAYGGGHAGASGGALPPAEWNAFARALGFGAEATVPEGDAAAAG